jgi:hypothetical protein
MRHRGPQRSTTARHTPTRRVAVTTATIAAIATSGVAAALGTSFAAAPTPSNRVNLIGNASFEHGLSGWHGSAASATRVRRAHTGKNDATVTSGLTTKVDGTTVAHGDYQASIWVATPTGSERAVLRVRETRNGKIVGQRQVQLALQAPGWHKLTLDYTAVHPADVLSYTVMRAGSGHGRLLVDDAWLSLRWKHAPRPVPSPTPSQPSPVPTTPAPTPTPVPPPSPGPSTGPSQAMIGSSFVLSAHFR